MRLTAALLLLAASAAAQDATQLARALAAKAEQARQFSYEADFRIEGQTGKNPGKLLSVARVKLAQAPGGKFLLTIAAEGKDEYTIVSNGEKTWSWVPARKQYSEEEGAVSAGEGGDDEEGGAGDDERDIAEAMARLVVPALAEMPRDFGGATMADAVPVKFEGRKERWPVLRVLSKKSDAGEQTMVEAALDTERLAVGRLVYANVSQRDGERLLLRLTADFRTFSLGEALPDNLFTFAPPRNARLVDAVPIPGQSGSFLVNKPAPDFELKSLDGQRIRLSDYRGKPVVLNFWASWCGPCRKELPGLDRIFEERSDGLVILGVNREGRGDARSYSDKAGLSFPTLDDASGKVSKLYRIQAIPSVYLIDRDGKVVRFLRGARDEAALRQVLKAAGF